MQPLYKITDKEAWGKEYNYSDKEYKFRTAVRAVIFDEQKKVPVLNVTKFNYYTLTGGGVENGETIEQALVRELVEEAACKTKQISPVGTILEVRYKPHKDIGLIQLNYCYLGKVSTKLAAPQFSIDEIEHGTTLEWVTIDQAIRLISNGSQGDYSNTFTQLRDLHLLELAKQRQQ